MQYRLACECGDGIVVKETAAGRKEMCRCGRTLVVPSLRELRRRAGVEQDFPPEQVVQARLLDGKLPEEVHCVLCGAATVAVVRCRTECERAYVQTSRPSWWMYLLAFFT